MPEQKTKKQVKKPRKKPDCRRLSLYPMKPEDAIKAVFEAPFTERESSNTDTRCESEET